MESERDSGQSDGGKTCCLVAMVCRCVARCYNTCELDFVFRLQGSVIPKAMVFAVPSAALAVGLHYFYRCVDSVPDHLEKSSSLWASFIFVLGVLITFRTNQAHARYWEGATLLLQVRGEWLNAASSLFAFCAPDEDKKAEVAKFQHQIVRLMSMLYCSALQEVALVADDRMQIIDRTGLDEDSIQFLLRSEERCDVLLQWIRLLIVRSMRCGVIPVPPPILTRVFQELSRGIVNAKDVKKIAEFPFPFPYSQLIAVMLIIQSVVTPVLASISGDDPIWAGTVTFTSVLALWSMNYIAAELEQPFGEDFNDLPIAAMMRDMNLRLRNMLQERAHMPPDFELSAATAECSFQNCLDCGYVSQKKHVEGFSKFRSSEGFHMESFMHMTVTNTNGSTCSRMAMCPGGSSLGEVNSQQSSIHASAFTSLKSDAGVCGSSSLGASSIALVSGGGQHAALPRLLQSEMAACGTCDSGQTRAGQSVADLQPPRDCAEEGCLKIAGVAQPHDLEAGLCHRDNSLVQQQHQCGECPMDHDTALHGGAGDLGKGGNDVFSSSSSRSSLQPSPFHSDSNPGASASTLPRSSRSFREMDSLIGDMDALPDRGVAANEHLSGLCADVGAATQTPQQPSNKTRSGFPSGNILPTAQGVASHTDDCNSRSVSINEWKDDRRCVVAM